MTRRLLMPSRRLLTASIWQNQKLPAGSSKPQLIVDGSSMPQPWIVKSINAGQGTVASDQSTFNDYVGSRIAEAAGFTVGEVAVMSMDDYFLDGYPLLRTQAYGAFTPGMHLAVKYYPGSQTLDHYFRRSCGSSCRRSVSIPIRQMRVSRLTLVRQTGTAPSQCKDSCPKILEIS